MRAPNVVIVVRGETLTDPGDPIAFIYCDAAANVLAHIAERGTPYALAYVLVDGREELIARRRGGEQPLDPVDIINRAFLSTEERRPLLADDQRAFRRYLKELEGEAL